MIDQGYMKTKTPESPRNPNILYIFATLCFQWVLSLVNSFRNNKAIDPIFLMLLKRLATKKNTFCLGKNESSRHFAAGY